MTGGLQDNGQSILRPGDKVMGSNFGGDGGDTIVDPANGCNIAQEYVYLAVWVTNNCAVNDGCLDDRPEQGHQLFRAPRRTTRPAEARFIAPLTRTPGRKVWVAGGAARVAQHQGLRHPVRPRTGQTLFDLGAGTHFDSRGDLRLAGSTPAGAGRATTRASPAASRSGVPTAPAGTS